MGRNCTGAYTTGECFKIDMGFLLRNGYIKKGQMVTGVLSWSYKRDGSNGGNIAFISHYTTRDKYLELMYTITYNDTGEKREMSYKVYFEAVPSNLGKGEIIYFLCPVLGRKCRILYRAYGSDMWKCRDAYPNRIYYPLQQCSKLDKYNTKYWELDEQLKKMNKQRKTSTYKGKMTKRAQKLQKMFNDLWLMDELRWSPAGMPKRLYGIAKA